MKRAPSLPERGEGVAWHALTVKWWRDLWRSPMSGEYLRADVHALFRLALLIDMFWQEPSTKLASEIRIEQQAFGMTPLDRRRLEWSVEQDDDAGVVQRVTTAASRKASTAPVPLAWAGSEFDPRAVLGDTG